MKRVDDATFLIGLKTVVLYFRFGRGQAWICQRISCTVPSHRVTLFSIIVNPNVSEDNSHTMVSTHKHMLHFLAMLSPRSTSLLKNHSAQSAY